MKRNEVEALFLLAGLEISNIYEIKNEYCSCCDPWWLVKTKYGLIKIGWRKRVANIDWSDTPYRAGETLFWDDRPVDKEYGGAVCGRDEGGAVCGRDEVTNGPTYVHAWSYSKVLEYLTTLALMLQRSVVNKEQYRQMWEEKS